MIAANATTTGALRVATLNLNGDDVTDITGSGLTISNGALSVTGLALQGSTGAWETAWTNALTPTSTTAGIFVNASSTFNSTLRVNNTLTLNSPQQMNSAFGVQRGSLIGRNYFTSDYNIYGGGVTRLARYMDYEIMDRENPIIQSALDIYESSICLKDNNGDYLKIYSPNTKIKNELEKLFYGIINLDFTLPQISRSMCKYGDHFAILNLEEGKGITGFFQIPATEIDKEEAIVDDKLQLFWKWIGDQSRRYKSYELAHFRINDIGLLPFGRSILDGARRPWKQLKMLEDGMMIYQISRAPETRVYYVDVGNIEPEKIKEYLTDFSNNIKRSTMVGQDGSLDLRYNPMGINEDIIIPMRSDRSSRVEALSGITGYPMDPIEYVQKTLFLALF
jgi:hypothetical protein